MGSSSAQSDEPAPNAIVLTAGAFDHVLEETTANLARSGDWLSAAERLDAWRLVRVPGAETSLVAEAVEVVERITDDPGRRTFRWAGPLIEGLGEETYTELVGVAAMAKVIDTADRALGRPHRALPKPEAGDPVRIRPNDVGDVGAWVPQTLKKARANVSRTLSLVPDTNDTWRFLVDRLYSRGAEFFELGWKRPLSRPQTELVAARTTALQQCFY